MRAIAAYRGLLGNGPLTRLLLGEFVSGIGDWLYIVALLVVVYRGTGDARLLGVFAAVRVIPYIALSIPAGVVADRFDRRLVLLITDLLRGGLMLAMAALIAVHGPVLLVMALAIVAAIGSTFFYPAIGGYIPNLVRDERELGPANSAWAALDNLGFVVGPALGGALLALGGEVLAFVINAGTFVVIAAILWRLPPSSTARRGTVPAVPAAPPATASQLPASPPPAVALTSALRPLTGLVILQFLGSALHNAVTVLTVILAVDVLHAGEAATGALNAAIGIGGVSGAIIAGALVLRRQLSAPLLLGGVALAGGFAALAVAPALGIAMLAITVHEAGHLILDVLVATILQRVVGDEARGRGVGIVMTSGALGEAAGGIAAPVAIALVGLTQALVGGGIVVFVSVVGALVLIGSAASRPESAFEAVLARVSRLPLFAGVPAARLERALGRLVERPVVAGETIVRQGERADRFYIVGTGTLVVTQRRDDGGEATLRTLGPDSVFGELGLLRGGLRTATVTAVTDGSLLALDAPDFLELVGGPGALQARMLALYADHELAPHDAGA